MRFIIPDDVFEGLPSDWDKKVEAAKAHVESKVKQAQAAAKAAAKSPQETAEMVDEARHKAIEDKQSVWRYAENALSDASHEKCWYCEIRQVRSDRAVDHFRPKNRVHGIKSHPGYWWLAFDWQNYRYSCTYCNSRRRDLAGGTVGGKRDEFPILPPPSHAHSESDPKDRAKLLDPTVDDDTKLLTFLPNGFPACSTTDPAAVDRVTESIRCYHLDHGPLVKRRKMLADEISQHVDQAEAANDAGHQQGFIHHKKEIIKKIRGKAELSTAARMYLQVYKTRRWVEEILSRDL
mgnify:CR=1 FL=1